MFANFVAETCTGTTGLITLTGAAYNSIPFAKKFVNTNTVAYVVEDADGIKKCGGRGVYNTANTITRNDSWTYDGNTYDEAPTGNLVLTGGIHTIRNTAMSSDGLLWNSALQVEATHTGEVIGDASLTVHVSSITNRTDVVPDSSDSIMLHDVTDNLLKKTTAAALADGGYF